MRSERWAGLSGLSVAFGVGGALLALLLTRPFFDWREDQFNSWQGIYVELAFFAFLPLVVGASAWFLRSTPSFLLIAASTALGAAMVAGDRHSAPLRYNNADSLVLAAFVYTAVTLLAVGLLLPMAVVLASLWRERWAFRR